VLVFFVFLVAAIHHRDPLESLLFAVALAVGLTPEFLPMIIAVTLAKGAVLMARQKVVVKHLAAIQNFGSMDILCSDKTGTLTRGEMELVKWLDPFGEPSDRTLLLAYLNSVHETGVKSPLDAAILQHAAPNITGYQKLDEVPFDFDRRRLSVVVEGPAGRMLIAKGAPEGVLECCTSYETAKGVSPLDAAARARFISTYEGLSGQGYRLLAVAYKSIPEQSAYRIADECDLCLVGLLAFLDPPREDAADSLRALGDDGVRVKVLTGDNDLVCRHVCEQVGLDGSRVVVGADLERMTDGALGQIAEQTDVFARLSPVQKTRVILALKARGHVVGYLGDGINDAPSLHAADVGISVSSAVDVAKDSAEIILLEPGLSVLHRGILEGRQAFGNVMKYLLMGTSSNFGNMFSMAAATVFLPFLPMLPSQVLLNNLLYDLAQLTIPTDRVDPSYIQKPHRWDIGLIRRFMFFIGPVSSLFDFLTFFVLLRVFHASEELFHTGWFVESLATQTLVVFVIRTGGNPFRSRPSRPLTLTVAAVVVVGIVLPYTPLAGLLGFVPLPAAYLLFVAAATALYLALVEVVKRFLLRRAFR
jgi:P-type Mg2+ transporter